MKLKTLINRLKKGKYMTVDLEKISKKEGWNPDKNAAVGSSAIVNGSASNLHAPSNGHTVPDEEQKYMCDCGKWVLCKTPCPSCGLKEGETSAKVQKAQKAQKKQNNGKARKPKPSAAPPEAVETVEVKAPAAEAVEKPKVNKKPQQTPGEQEAVEKPKRQLTPLYQYLYDHANGNWQRLLENGTITGRGYKVLITGAPYIKIFNEIDVSAKVKLQLDQVPIKDQLEVSVEFDNDFHTIKIEPVGPYEIGQAVRIQTRKNKGGYVESRVMI